MDAKERIRKAMHQEPTDRPPCICPGGMMNMITTDLMDEANVSWPEAHLNARMMADLAEANYEKGCFENVGVPFCMTIEAEAMGAQVTMGSKIYEPHVTVCFFFFLTKLFIKNNRLHNGTCCTDRSRNISDNRYI